MEERQKSKKILMPRPYIKLSKKEFKQAYANRKTSSKIQQKESEIKKLFDLIFKKQNWCN